MTFYKKSFCFLVLLSGMACSPDDGGGSGPGASGGAGGSDGAGGGASGCELPAGAEVVMPWQKLLPVDGSSSSTPAYDLATDGTSLFVNFFDQVAKMPLAGGSVTNVYQSSKSIPLGFAMFQGNGGVLVEESGSWVKIPFSGGAAAPLALTLPAGAEVIDVDPSTDAIWARTQDFSAKTVSIVKITPGAAAPETLIAGVSKGYGERWVRSGDRFFTQGGGDLSAPDRSIYVATTGGAPAPFAVDPPNAKLIGATATHIFYVADALESDKVGLYRVPAAGGASERIFDSYSTGSGQPWNTDGAIFVNDATNLLKLPDSGNAKKISSVPTQSCTTHTVLAHGGYVYTVTYKSLSGENVVWRIKE